MALVDFPLTADQFADAVQKGLGRAVMAIDGPVSDEYKKVIINACLFDVRYDNWSEHGRAPYMMRMADKAELTDIVLSLLLEPFNDDIGNRAKRLRKYMLVEYSRRGEQRAFDALVPFALSNDEETWEAIAYVGAKGVEWLTINILPNLEFDERWRAKYWRDDCEGVLSVSIAEELDAFISAHQEFQDLRPKYVPAKRPETLDEALEEVATKRVVSSSIWYLAEKLTDDEVQRVANLWLNEKDLRRARSYALLFQVRDFPFRLHIIADRVIAEDPPFDFESVLSYCEHPKVREFGLSLINKDMPDYRGYECLKSSFLDEDIPFLIQSLDRFVGCNQQELHDLCTAIRDMCETIPTAELRAPFLIWNYEHNPCSFCRNIAAEIMAEDGTLPHAYRQEMAFDADSDTRKLVLEIS